MFIGISPPELTHTRPPQAPPALEPATDLERAQGGAQPGGREGTAGRVSYAYRSMSAKSLAGVAQYPTAAQVVVLGHDTPSRAASVAPLGFGLATIDQLVPFHCSTNVLKCEFVKLEPTAKQLVVLGHGTLPKEPFGGPNGFGLGATDHAGVALAGTAATPIAPVTKPTETTSPARSDRHERHEHNNGLVFVTQNDIEQPS